MDIFVTGASGWIGSATVPKLLEAGHSVSALARSDDAAAALQAAGATVVRGSLDDLDVLSQAAAASDGVVHLAFHHELAFSGDFGAAVTVDRQVVEAFGEALKGSDRPLVIATGLAGHPSGMLVTEDVPAAPDTGASARMLTEQYLLGLASSGVRAVSVRLSPTVHGDGDQGFVPMLVGIARERGVSGYIGEGRNTWPAVHRLDAADLFRRAVEDAPAGTALHGVAEEGVPTKAIAEAIGHGLDLPVASIAPDDAGEHFGWLASFFAIDVRASSALTRERTGWDPTHPALLDDLGEGHYFA